MTDPAVAAPAANDSDTSWAASAAHSAFEFKVSQWAGDMKDAIDHAKPPQVPESAISLANLVYFNMAVDGAKAWFPKSTGAVLSRFAGPIAVLNAASTAFESSYKAHARAVNDKLSKKYNNARDDFRDKVNKAADNFMTQGTAGRQLWNHLTKLLKQQRTLDRLNADSQWEYPERRPGIASDFAKQVIREAQIFPNNADLRDWARISFEDMLEKIKAVYLHSPMHKPGTSDLTRPGRGHVYVVGDHGVRDFPSLGEAGRVCLHRNYNWNKFWDWLFDAQPCFKDVEGRRITSKADFHFLLRNGWLFKIEPETVTQTVNRGVVRMKHIAIVPIEDAKRGLKENVMATRDALDRGYEKALRKA